MTTSLFSVAQQKLNNEKNLNEGKIFALHEGANFSTLKFSTIIITTPNTNNCLQIGQITTCNEYNK